MRMPAGVGGRTNGRQGLSQLGFNNNGSLSSTVTGQPAYNWNGGYRGYPLNPPFFYPSFGIGYITAAARLRCRTPPARAPPRPSTFETPISAAKLRIMKNWSFKYPAFVQCELDVERGVQRQRRHWLPWGPRSPDP